jgi:hypothetical protein
MLDTTTLSNGRRLRFGSQFIDQLPKLLRRRHLGWNPMLQVSQNPLRQLQQPLIRSSIVRYPNFQEVGMLLAAR